MTQTRVLFARHSAAHDGSSLRLRPLHSHSPPHDLSRSRNDLLFSECSQKRSLHVHLNLSRGNYEWAKTPAGVHPLFQFFSTAGRRAPSGAGRYIPRKLEQLRIPAKNAATPHLNAMGIAPKVVAASFSDSLLLTFR